MALTARSEEDARRILAAINEKIRAANRTGIAGPPLMLVPYDVERVIAEWRNSRPEFSRN